MDDHPSFSRMALAAALLEYDNDIDDPYKEYRDHRQSAVFRQFHQKRRAPELPPLEVRGQGQGFAGIGAGQGSEGRGRPLPMPPMSDARSAFSHQSGGDMPADIPADVNIDLDDWDLPKHMVAHTPTGYSDNQIMSGSQPTSPGPLSPGQIVSPGGYAAPPYAGQPISPGQIMSPAGGPYYSPVGGAPEFPPGAPDLPPPSPAFSSGSLNRRSMDVGAFAAEHGGLARQGDSRTTSLVTHPIPRPRSVHVESIDNLDGSPNKTGEYSDDMPGRHSLDAYGAEADAAIRESAGGRPTSNRRSSTIATLALQDNWEARRPANPIMVPLPDSPTSDRFGAPPAPAVHSRPAPGLEMDERDILDNAFKMDEPLELGTRFAPRKPLSIDLTGSDAGGDLTRRRSLVYYDDGRPESMRSGRGSFYGPGSDMGAGESSRPVFDDIPSAQEYGRPLRPPKYGNQAYRMARQQLLRPKTLIMPAPLEGNDRPTITVHVPDGFTLGEKPLPEDARASILNQGKGVPLSLAQKTFRSSLMVGGTRDDGFLGQADEGEMIPGIPEEERYQDQQERRGPGKLYGTSLIDQLEARKHQQASRKRVFYGDHRPSMMARTTQTQSTLFDQNLNVTEGGDPAARPMSYAPGGDNRLSMMPGDPRPKSYAPGVPPTINFPDEDAEDGDIGNAAATARATNTRSVFGVDTVWEREMAKLKEIQMAEANARLATEAEARAKEEAKAAKAQAKIDARQSKLIANAANRKSFFAVGSGNSRKSMLNPDWVVPENTGEGDFVRPMSIAFGPGGVIIPTGEDSHDEGDEGDEDEAEPRTSRLSDRPPALELDPEAEDVDLSAAIPASPQAPPARRAGSRAGVDTWYGDSEDEDEPLSKSKGRGKANVLPPIRAIVPAADDSSDEDVPLSRLKVVDSDEEVPLSRLRKGTTTASGTATTKPSLPNIPGGGLTLDLPSPVTPLSPTSPNSGGVSPAVSGDAADDDDEPLWLRKERAKASAPEKTKEEIEDDLPLAWKHAGAAGGAGGPNANVNTPGRASFMPNSASFYGQPNPYAYGMGGMGGMMPPPMMNMGHHPMGMPPMGGMGAMGGGYPGYEMPDPGSNIDKWRQGVSGRAGSVVGSVAPSVAPSQAGH